jgi:Tol biopolymer transport system component/C-terminal processing protease CtpA/Prc
MSKAHWLVVSAAAWGAFGGVAAAQEVSSNWFRSPAVSPDGSTIVFASGGDLYVVPASGGTARPLTIHGAYETRPVWSHDGRWIAFASDRHGNLDVFVMPAAGGEAKRLTWHSADDLPSDFTPDDAAVIFESNRTDDVSSTLFPSGALAELYRVPVAGGTPDMLLTTPALRAVYDADGGQMLYEDRKGYENELRKHHTSSVARDIWVYDTAAGSHTKLTEFAGEDRNPQWAADGQSFYFLSERSGDFNVWRMPVRAGAQAEQLTRFERHPVRDLSVSGGGVAVFSWHGDIYRMAGGGQPQIVPIQLGSEGRHDTRVVLTARSGATEFSASSNGKEVAFVVRGDVFVTSVEFGTTRRITQTPEQERSVDFAPDGRALVYAGERDGSWNIYETKLADEDELYFFSGTSFTERALVATEAEEFQPRYSPDGKKVAYLHNRTAVHVVDIESGEVVTALDGDLFYSYEDGDHWYRWAPDGSYLATQFLARGFWLGQVGLVPSDGSGAAAPMELSNSGYEDLRPRWGMDGGVVLWSSERYGERSHGSWGAEQDVLAVFLNQDAFDKFHMSKEEYELKKELEKKHKEKEEEDKKKEEEKAKEAEDAVDDATPGDQAAEDDEAQEAEQADEDAEEEEPEPLEIDMKGIEARTVRLTPHSSDLGDFAMSPEGDRLYYLAKFEAGYDLWVRDFREDETKMLKKLGADAASMQLNKDGDTMFVLADGSLSKVDTKSGETKPIKYGAEIDLDGDAEREYLFGHVWRQTLQKFYREDMHGVDWAFYRDQYAPKLAGISDNEDMAVVLSELLGELDASHTGGIYRPGPTPGAASTASLGLFYDNGFDGPGMRIAEVMEGGPLDRADLDIQAGMVITQVDGKPVDASSNYFAMLDGRAGERVRLTLQREDGSSFDQVVRPVGLGQENELRYERWVKQRREMVERLSNGRLGYVHIRGMNDASFRVVYSEVLGRYADREALIVDTRFNGGGWLHDDLVTFLTGKPYVDLYPRNVEAPGKKYFGEPARRWTKPSAVLMSESNYSDAHFFPWAYAELKIGPTIGMPVPGTATAVWWERLHTGDLIFGIPQVGTKGASGTYLENDQLEPTYEVRITPEDAAAGRDTQLEKAVAVMLGVVETE